ncbi:MAG: hypothetical protein U9N81_02615 [Bacillota bacterium]|nr:hypothetical protein [Bacillota bacterium]
MEDKHMEAHQPSFFHSVVGFVVAGVIGGFFLYAMNFLLSS